MNYLLIYDNSQLQYDRNDIHRFVTTSSKVTDWWHYLPNVYILSTQLTVNQITESFAASYPGLRFIILKHEFSEYNGVLHKDAWEWIKRKTNQLFKIKPASPPKPINMQDILKKALETPASNKNDTDAAMKALSELLKKK